MASAVVASSVTKVIGAPIKHFIQGEFAVQRGDGTSKVYTVTPILLRDRKEATEFLAACHDEFYRNGKPLPKGRAAARVDTLIQRLMHEEAWSSWLVRDEENRLVAWWTIGYDDREGHLQAALMVEKNHQNEKLATGIWQFTAKFLFPILAQQGAKVNSQEDLKQVDLYALSHPDHAVMNKALQNAGFELESQTYDKDFENVASDGKMLHDGSRNRWKIPVAKILASSSQSASS